MKFWSRNINDFYDDGERGVIFKYIEVDNLRPFQLFGPAALVIRYNKDPDFVMLACPCENCYGNAWDSNYPYSVLKIPVSDITTDSSNISKSRIIDCCERAKRFTKFKIIKNTVKWVKN